MSMQASGIGRFGPEELERELRRSLYRFDCPDAQVLGEYELGLLEAAERTRIAAHAADCDDCRAELQTLRAFLAAPIRVPDSLVDRARRVVATLFSPAPGLAYGGLRGTTDSATRVYEAGDVTVTLGPGQSSGSLFGLVVSSGSAPEELEGRSVTLTSREGAARVARLDDLGNFEFTDVPPGPYALEIDLPDGVVVIEELQVD
jgi:hypothetical protein